MPKIHKNKKKHVNPRYFLNEGYVEMTGYGGQRAPWDTVKVIVDGVPKPLEDIFDELDLSHPDWSGWKGNIIKYNEMSLDEFMSEQAPSAVEDWAEWKGHRFVESENEY